MIEQMDNLSTTPTTTWACLTAGNWFVISATCATSNDQDIAKSCFVYNEIMNAIDCKNMTAEIAMTYHRITSSCLYRECICSVVANNYDSTTTFTTCSKTALHHRCTSTAATSSVWNT